MLTTSPLSNHHLKYPLLQWGHNHYHTEGQTSPETQGDKLQDTIHSPWRCRTDILLIPHLRTPAQEPRRQRTLLEGRGVLGTELYLVPSSCLTHFETQASDTLKQAKACIYPSTVYTKWRLIPEKTQHPPKQKVVTDISQYNRWRILILTSRPRSHFLKPWPVLYCRGPHCSSRLLTWKHHIQATHCPTLADAVPTDPIDDVHRLEL